jgi:hypothetical protein
MTHGTCGSILRRAPTSNSCAEARRRNATPPRNHTPARRMCQHGHTQTLLPTLRNWRKSSARPLGDHRQQTQRPRDKHACSNHLPPPRLRISHRAHRGSRREDEFRLVARVPVRQCGPWRPAPGERCGPLRHSRRHGLPLASGRLRLLRLFRRARSGPELDVPDDGALIEKPRVSGAFPQQVDKPETRHRWSHRARGPARERGPRCSTPRLASLSTAACSGVWPT